MLFACFLSEINVGMYYVVLDVLCVQRSFWPLGFVTVKAQLSVVDIQCWLYAQLDLTYRTENLPTKQKTHLPNREISYRTEKTILLPRLQNKYILFKGNIQIDKKTLQTSPSPSLPGA